MSAVMKVLRGMLVLRRIAAANVAAGAAEPQMDPGVSHFEALFAAVGFRLHVEDLLKV